MASIAHYRQILKNDFSLGQRLLAGLWQDQFVVQAAMALGHRWRNRIWTPAQTLWTFLLQVLTPGSSCREAVSASLAQQAADHPVTCSADPSGYCQGRQRLPVTVFRHCLGRMARCLQAKTHLPDRWRGHRVWVVDGSSCSMPDTPALQDTFGQPDRQRQGCGFPVAKIVAMFEWTTGAVHDIAMGKYRSNELGLWYSLWHLLRRGDVVLGDRFYGTFACLAALQGIGCHGVFRLHGARKVDFRQGKRLGKNDRLMTWSRPALTPRGMPQEWVQRLPEGLTVRVRRFSVMRPGFRSRSITIATTLLDPAMYPAGEIARLYGDRWTVELRLRDIKTTLGMDVLRGRSPDIVRKEIYMHLLAYNLIRTLMVEAAGEHACPLHRLSFAGTVQHLRTLLPYLWLFAGTLRGSVLTALLLDWIAHDMLPHRPGRLEPRAKKRRAKTYSLMVQPRSEMRKALLL
jgi:hypothetical protein